VVILLLSIPGKSVKKAHRIGGPSVPHHNLAMHQSVAVSAHQSCSTSIASCRELTCCEPLSARGR
jgi:hypothetical protein